MRKSRRNNKRGGCGCSTTNWFSKGGNCPGVVQLKGGFSKKRKNKRKTRKNTMKIGGNIAYYSNSINTPRI